MTPNLRSLVAQAYRVRQGYISIYEWLLSRGLVWLTGFGVASYITGDVVSKLEEEQKEIDREVVEFLEKRGKLPPGYLDSMYKS